MLPYKWGYKALLGYMLLHDNGCDHVSCVRHQLLPVKYAISVGEA